MNNTIPTPQALESMLNAIPLPLPYDDYVRVCKAVYSAYPDNVGINLIVSWSQAHFKAGENPHKVIEAKFKSFSRYSGREVGIGTLVHMARGYGWIPSEYPANLPGRVSSPPRPQAIQAPACVLPCLEWQEIAQNIAIEANDYLLTGYELDTQQTAKVRQWLGGRGIYEAEVRHFRLGFWEGGKGLSRGVTIPAWEQDNLWYLKSRTSGQIKYAQLKGGYSKSLFGCDQLLNPAVKMAIVTEGELDAVLLSRFLPTGIVAISMGSANQLPGRDSWYKYFALLNRVYVIQDNDQTGRDSLKKWESVPNVTPLPMLPHDVTEAWQKGENLTSWLYSAGVFDTLL